MSCDVVAAGVRVRVTWPIGLETETTTPGAGISSTADDGDLRPSKKPRRIEGDTYVSKVDWGGTGSLGLQGRPAVLGPDANVPVVFLLHGRTGKKENLDAKARTFAALGFLCCYWDLPNHVERMLEPRRNEGWDKRNRTHAADMYGQMLQSVKEISLMIDLLPTLLGLSFARTAVFGISQGGHAALLAFTAESRLDVCVSLIGSGDYKLNMVKRYSELVSGSPMLELSDLPDFEALFPKALADVVEANDPITHVEELAKGECTMIT